MIEPAHYSINKTLVVDVYICVLQPCYKVQLYATNIWFAHSVFFLFIVVLGAKSSAQNLQHHIQMDMLACSPSPAGKVYPHLPIKVWKEQKMGGQITGLRAGFKPSNVKETAPQYHWQSKGEGGRPHVMAGWRRQRIPSFIHK